MGVRSAVKLERSNSSQQAASANPISSWKTTHAMTKNGQGGELLDPKRLVHALAVEAVKYISSHGSAVFNISPWLWYAGMSNTAGNIVSTRQIATPKRFLLSSVAQALHRSSAVSNFRAVSECGMAPRRSALRQSWHHKVDKTN